MYPVIIPVNIEPSKCPNCGKTEDKIEICRNCKYEYKEELKYPYWWISLLVSIFSLYGTFYLLFSLIDTGGGWWIFPTAIISLAVIIIFNIGIWGLLAKEVK